MSAVTLQRPRPCARAGLKGPRAAAWLEERGITVPAAPNRWTVATSPAPGDSEGTSGEAPSASDGKLLVARLGFGEFFLEDCPGGTTLARWASALQFSAGVYPVLREDAALVLSGQDAPDVLAQICNVNFGELALSERPLVMTQMVGVSVLVIARDAAISQGTAVAPAAAMPQGAADVRYRIWCDPTFGGYLERTIGAVVLESGGSYRGAA